MFRTAELGQAVSKSEYKRREPPLRQALLESQIALREAGFPVIVLLAGVDGAGKGETVNLLNEWMDPRWIATHAFDAPTTTEVERPRFWRYWQTLPPRGRIGLYLSAWYHDPFIRRVYDEIDETTYVDELESIAAFERTLADDGALVLKFWMHLGKEAQKARLEELQNDPLRSWRVNERDWRHWEMYERFIPAAERLIARTSNAGAPWTIVEGSDARFRSLKVGEMLLEALRKRLDKGAGRSTGDEDRQGAPARPIRTVLSTLDTSLELGKQEYKTRLPELQAELNLLHRQARERGISTLLVFEGWDAAGKGGAIRRVARALDARSYNVVQIAAPTDEERAHHYLWRFWRHLPRAGRFLIFDRSWYGRVLVERVEGFAREAEWRRAYAEINDFERQLVSHGMVLVKFWIHISKDEQKTRFKQREKTPYKRFKLTDEDWRNREKWDAYETAVHAMVERTSTRVAPWTLVEGNDKRYARVKVLKAVCDGLRDRLAQDPSVS